MLVERDEACPGGDLRAQPFGFAALEFDHGLAAGARLGFDFHDRQRQIGGKTPRVFGAGGLGPGRQARADR